MYSLPHKLLLAAALLCGTACSAREEPPDLVLVIIDTWRWDGLGANGSIDGDLTPNLDALAASGTRFSRAVASSSWTLPTVASIFTGHYPSVHSAYGHYMEVGKIRPDLATLPERLQAQGYQTLAVVNAPFMAPTFGFGRGFDRYDKPKGGTWATRPAQQAVQRALKHLAAADKDRPAFLLLHLFDPHLSYDPPEPWNARWSKPDYSGPYSAPFTELDAMRSGEFAPSSADLEFILGLYRGEIAYVDHVLGSLFERLDDARPGRPRAVVVTADHGEEFGEHGAWEHGQSMYRELVQVPLVVVLPAGAHVERPVVDAQVRTFDVFPTLLELAGAEVPAEIPASSLLALMQAPDAPAHRLAYSEREHFGTETDALRDGKYTLVHYADERPDELYDQTHDAQEERDIAAEQPEVAAELAARRAALVRALEALGGNGDALPELDEELVEQLRSLGYLGR